MSGGTKIRSVGTSSLAPFFLGNLRKFLGILVLTLVISEPAARFNEWVMSPFNMLFNYFRGLIAHREENGFPY